MKTLLVGLGNPGAQYHNTRHNVGFMVLDALAEAAGATWKTERLADVAHMRAQGRAMVLIKPNTFMNLSGRAVRYWLDQEKLKADDMLVVTDDLDLPFGRLRLRGVGSPGTHNGLKDIDAVLGNGTYARLRFGIDRKFERGAQIDYVLGPFGAQEQPLLPARLEAAGKAAQLFAARGLVIAMNEVNRSAM